VTLCILSLADLHRACTWSQIYNAQIIRVKRGDNAENRRNNKADERRITRSRRLDTLDAHLVPTRRYGKTLRSSRTTRKPPGERGSVPIADRSSTNSIEEDPVANERSDVAGNQRLALRPSAPASGLNVLTVIARGYTLVNSRAYSLPSAGDSIFSTYYS